MSDTDVILKKFNETAYDIGKLLITLSTGMVVLSVTFNKGMLQDILRYRFLLFAGWILELASIVLGTFFLYSMLRVYDTWENIRTYYKPAIILGVLQYIGFIGGLISLTAFTAVNLK